MRRGAPLDWGAAGGPESGVILGEVIQAVRAFVNADDWAATRRVVEAHQALLFRPEVEEFFEANIAQARADGNEQAAEYLEMHLALLRACRMEGVAAVFDRLGNGE